ncbi:MAG: hypothetical protein NC409_08625 [Clostridium sp.]|nr:hypothetical protein [Clostridium sp.]
MSDIANPCIDRELFLRACDYVRGLEKGAMGIGTLSEKTIHAIMKYYYAPDPAYHERKVGAFVADIMVDGEIMEIQTRAFNSLRRKLDAFLPGHDVTVIYPIAHTKWLSWIDPETGEVTKPRKSPKTGTIYHLIPELYKLKMYLQNERLHFTVPFIDVQETRILDGWSYNKKRGSHRSDGVPVGIFDEVRINTREDYRVLLPEGLPEEFTTKDYKRAAHVPAGIASTALNILFSLELVERVGKEGNAYIYREMPRGS